MDYIVRVVGDLAGLSEVVVCCFEAFVFGVALLRVVTPPVGILRYLSNVFIYTRCLDILEMYSRQQENVRAALSSPE